MCSRLDRILWQEIVSNCISTHIVLCKQLILGNKILLIVKLYSVVLVKLIIFMTNTLQHLLNFVHEGFNVIYAWSRREIAYKVPYVLKTGFPCRYCTYQV
jgi:deoxycytidylate deaminase